MKFLFFVTTWLLSVSLFCEVTQAEVYSSAADMKSIFQLEKELVNVMNGYASKLESKLNRINNYLEVMLSCFYVPYPTK